LKAGDIIDLILPPPPVREIIPEDIALNILYEDDDIIILNKQADLIVHPARAIRTARSLMRLRFISQAADRLRRISAGIVHRLDRNTTGVMVVAKTDTAHWRISRQFENRQTKKSYMAIVHGTPELTNDVIDKPLGVHPKSARNMQ